MGRLAKTYNGAKIVERYQYEMPGELLAFASTDDSFPQSQFINDEANGRPFEIHRMIVRLTAFDDGSYVNGAPNDAFAQPFEPQPDVSMMIEIQIRDLSRNEDVTKAASLVGGLSKANTQTWDWEEPFTIDDQAGFLVDVIPSSFAYFATALVPILPPSFEVPDIHIIRVEIVFEGYLLELEQPEVQTA